MRYVPETSREAYRFALDKKLISKKEYELTQYFIQHDCEAGHTTKEMMKKIGSIIGNNSWDKIQNYQKVVNILEKKQVLTKMEPRHCMASATNRRAHPYRISFKHPSPPIKKPNKDKRIKELELACFAIRDLVTSGVATRSRICQLLEQVIEMKVHQGATPILELRR